MRVRIPVRRAFLALCVVAVARAPAAAQQLSKLDRERGRVMLTQVREDLEKHYYDSTFKGTDLATRFAAAESRVVQATSVRDIFAGIAQTVLDLDDSHTFWKPPALTTSVEYGWEMQIVGDSCFVTRVTPGSDADKQGLAEGDAILAVNGRAPTRGNLWKLLYIYHLLRPQPGLRVVVKAPDAAPRQLDIAAKVREEKRMVDISGADGGVDFWKLVREAEDEWLAMRPRYVELSEDVLIWKLAAFDNYDRSVGDGMKKARGHRALILDLRGNGGGDERALLALLGHFFPGRTQVGTLRRRTGTAPLVAEGKGDKAFTGQLVVLIDSRSSSASEVFARAIQLAGRGIVLGDRSAGEVMRSRFFPHQVGIDRVIFHAMSVADADVTMSDGERLEGTGVIPDEPVLPTSADLAAARDPVLARAAALAGASLTAEEAGKIFRQPGKE